MYVSTVLSRVISVLRYQFEPENDEDLLFLANAQNHPAAASDLAVKKNAPPQLGCILSLAEVRQTTANRTRASFGLITQDLCCSCED